MIVKCILDDCFSINTIDSRMYINDVREAGNNSTDKHIDHVANNAPAQGNQEHLVYTDGFASAAEREVRDRVIAHGYDNSVSNQPYATNLAKRMELVRERTSSGHDLSTMAPKDQEYVHIIIRELYPNYTPGWQHLNSTRLRAFLKKLP